METGGRRGALLRGGYVAMWLCGYVGRVSVRLCVSLVERSRADDAQQLTKENADAESDKGVGGQA